MKALEFRNDDAILPLHTISRRHNIPMQQTSLPNVIPVSHNANPVLAANSKLSTSPTAITEALHVYGVKSRIGHSMSRHRKRNNAVWQKIQNWD